MSRTTGPLGLPWHVPSSRLPCVVPDFILWDTPPRCIRFDPLAVGISHLTTDQPSKTKGSICRETRIFRISDCRIQAVQTNLIRGSQSTAQLIFTVRVRRATALRQRSSAVQVFMTTHFVERGFYLSILKDTILRQSDSQKRERERGCVCFWLLIITEELPILRTVVAGISSQDGVTFESLGADEPLKYSSIASRLILKLDSPRFILIFNPQTPRSKQG